MNSSKNSRFLLSTFTAALMVFSWTGASHADLWVASGTDMMGRPVTVDVAVITTVIQNDVGFTETIQITISNSSLTSEGTSDLVLETTRPLNSPVFTFPQGSVLSDWNQAFNSNTLTLTSQTGNSGTTGGDDNIEPGASASLTITTTFTMNELENEVGGVMISTQDGSEIAANLVPEPSTMVIATLGALGFLGYSFRRRKAKLTAVAV